MLLRPLRRSRRSPRKGAVSLPPPFTGGPPFGGGGPPAKGWTSGEGGDLRHLSGEGGETYGQSAFGEGPKALWLPAKGRRPRGRQALLWSGPNESPHLSPFRHPKIFFKGVLAREKLTPTSDLVQGGGSFKETGRRLKKRLIR